MKVLVLLLGLGGVVFLLAGGCSGQFTTWYTDSQGVQHTHCWSGCTSGSSHESRSSVSGSAIMEDALVIHAASISTNGDEANIAVFGLVDRATRKGGSAGEALVRQKLPSLAAGITSAMPTVRARMLALDLQTSAGQGCRMAVLRELARTQSLYRAVSDDFAANRAPAGIVHRVISGENATSRAFTSDLKPCLAGLQPDTRAAVKYVLGG